MTEVSFLGGFPAIGCNRYLWYSTNIMHDPGFYQIPISEPPLPVRHYGGFGSDMHGLRGSEPYKNAFWVLNVAEGGEGYLHVHGQRHHFYHGCAVIAPPDTMHSYDFLTPTRKTYAHFRGIRGAKTAPFPIVRDLGDDFEWFKTRILEASRMMTAEPDRARAMLWDLLWRLSAGPCGGDKPVHHPAIRLMLAWLAEHPAKTVVPDELAFHCGCSAAHLNRLCGAAFGAPLLAYVRRCRIEGAEYLLRHTTRPISHIAAEAGYPDLQHFNKLMRKFTGLSPRKIRETSDTALSRLESAGD